jgi:hypothetical protein
MSAYVPREIVPGAEEMRRFANRCRFALSAFKNYQKWLAGRRVGDSGRLDSTERGALRSVFAFAWECYLPVMTAEGFEEVTYFDPYVEGWYDSIALESAIDDGFEAVDLTLRRLTGAATFCNEYRGVRWWFYPSGEALAGELLPRNQLLAFAYAPDDAEQIALRIDPRTIGPSAWQQAHRARSEARPKTAEDLKELADACGQPGPVDESAVAELVLAVNDRQAAAHPPTNLVDLPGGERRWLDIQLGPDDVWPNLDDWPDDERQPLGELAICIEAIERRLPWAEEFEQIVRQLDHIGAMAAVKPAKPEQSHELIKLWNEYQSDADPARPSFKDYLSRRGALGTVAITFERRGQSHQIAAPTEGDETPPLDGNEDKILRALKAKSPRLLNQYELEQEASLSRRTIGKAARRLAKLGLIHRPMGPRKGWGLTPSGRK